MKQLYFLMLLLIAQQVLAQNPLLIKNVGGTVTEPKNKDQNEWQNNLWNGKRFYMGTGTPFKLCVTNGTSAGTAFVTDLGTNDASIINFIPARDFIYIATNRLINNFSQIVWELWKSDGTAAGTALVKSFDPHSFSTSGCSFTSDALNQFNYSIDGNMMYFAGYSTANGQEPWRTDGTVAGTYMIKDIKPGTGPSYAGSFCKIGNTTLFRAATVGFGATLWKTDGTDAGTVDVGVPGLTLDNPVARVNNKMIFYGNSSATDVDMEPWVTDGTVAGTFRLADINPGPGKSSPSSLQNLHLRFNDKYAFFIAQAGNNVKNLWRTDGTSAGTIKLTTDSLINEENFSGGGYSVIDNNGLWWIGGNEKLYFSNGTVAGTRRVTNALYNAQYMCLYKGAAWFHARNADRVNNAEPYRSDGTAANTRLALEVQPGQTSSGPFAFFELNNKLYFFSSYSPARNLYQYTGDMTFNGSVAGNRWRDSANWNSMMPPGITDTAFINANTTVNVNGGHAMTGTLQLQAGATINIANTTDSLSIQNALHLSANNNFTGNGFLVFNNINGDTSRINGEVAATNINIQRAVSLNGNVGVNNTISLSNSARLLLNTNTLTLNGTMATISGNASNYIVTNGTGKLSIQNMGSGGRASAQVYPIGTSLFYNPVTITNTGIQDVLSARVVQGINTAYTGEANNGAAYNGGAVNSTWFITEGTPGGSNANITLQWNAAQELPAFNRSQTQFGHYTGGSWQLGMAAPAAGSDPYTFTGTNITGFSPFGLFNASATLPVQSVQLAVQKSADANMLSWRINATNANGLTIETSPDGRNFVAIYQAAYSPAGNYKHVAVLAGKTYYRLRISDNNGVINYSNVVVMDNEKQVLVQVYPTVFHQIIIVQSNVAGVMFRVLNNYGQLRFQQKLVEGTNHIAMPAMAAGSYPYQLYQSGNILLTGMLVHQ